MQTGCSRGLESAILKNTSSGHSYGPHRSLLPQRRRHSTGVQPRNGSDFGITRSGVDGHHRAGGIFGGQAGASVCSVCDTLTGSEDLYIHLPMAIHRLQDRARPVMILVSLRARLMPSLCSTCYGDISVKHPVRHVVKEQHVV